ncbi:hypothetical protein PAXRUDRAFT_642431 [Paxillus rubicundulus Ve08.2h10]|uniref:Uncharacterized protein n=1 Tax=Paxillus rubicundulus Ve08.2h10 TaxID=930991 RepID=A0A0D0DXP4_9AGAM|nr:hypothetical protein PAXRUDRAFT_642431 [Paxillus rubicundulus Ve08.2h10]
MMKQRAEQEKQTSRTRVLICIRRCRECFQLINLVFSSSSHVWISRHLMLRHGMLSPNSKLLPQSAVDPTRLSIASDFSLSSYLSNTSNVSLASTTSTSSKHLKDARDTPQRRVRHRDGKLLKGGIGLTTGLGWSDSEDEDAPSPLTRRLSSLVLTRRVSSSVNSYRSSHSQSYLPHPLSRSISHSILREVDEYEADEFGYSLRDSVAPRSFPTRSQGISRVGSTHSVGSSSLGRYSTLSTSSSSAPGRSMRANSGSASSSYGVSASSKTNSFHNGNGVGTGLALSIPEQDDGVTPTRAAFERSNLPGTATDLPHTPSSTASSVSIPFPATPESTEDLPKSHPGYNKNKMLPPLPASGKGKYPSSLGLRSPAGALQRPRTYSNASSVSTNSVLGLPPSGPDGSTSRGPSPVLGIPRPSIGGAVPRPPVGGTPRPSITGTPRPSLSGGLSLNGATPRPSLAIPRPSLSAGPRSSFSAVPRPITPSSAPASANGTTSPGYAPRQLKLVPRSATLSSLNTSQNIHFDQALQSQSLEKPIQPGEQPPRPGQMLTYNRNVHDQLKLRALSPNAGYGPTHVMPISPGGTQTLFIPSSSSGPNPSSTLSTPSTSPLQESPKPKPRTGTGMVYRTNLTMGGASPSRMRLPSSTQR